MAWLSGCIPSKPSADEVETIPSERLVKKLEANRRKVKSFEGSGTLLINTDKINTSANFKIWLHKPDSIYLEIYGPFGIDLAQALVTNNKFQFFDAMHNTLYKGNTNSDVLQKIFKVNMSFNDLLDAFVGAVNMNSRLSSEPDKYEIKYDKYILTYNDPS
jgi:outer membrane biogenesis lipoprotein LolB